MIVRLSGWWANFAAALQFLTRLPRWGKQDRPFDLARGGGVLPLVGALVGALTGVVYWAARAGHLPAFIAATLAVAVAAALTGALHEDGLADTADGFGGGQNQMRKLAIMTDSHIGTYGVLTLIFATATKIGCIASMTGRQGLLSLVAAHALARSTLPFLAYSLPPAKTTGLAVLAGRPHARTLCFAFLFAIAIAATTLTLIAALASVLLVMLVTLVMRQTAQRQIGGYTGDVLGATEQCGELAVLLAVMMLA